MGLDYHFSFKAPASTARESLEQFLKSVEPLALKLGFRPCIVMAVPFDTPERQQFARRLTAGEEVQNEAFVGVDIPEAFDQNKAAGSVRLLPIEGAFLAVTDERGNETVFAFFKYPQKIVGVDTGLSGWRSRNWVTSPDPRYREIARKFADAGYLDEEIDEYL